MNREKIDYLVELYNVHLPEGDLSPENKKRLLRFMNKFFGYQPASQDPGDSEGKPLYPEVNLEHRGGYYDIRHDGIWYFPPNDSTPTNWLEGKDFIESFQCDYQPLRKCIDRFCVEGDFSQFSRPDLSWLKNKAELIRYTTSDLAWIDEVLDPKCLPAATRERVPGLNKWLSEGPDLEVLPEGYIPTFTLGFGDDSPLSDSIIVLAILGLIETINKGKKGKFRRCASPDCNNIFIATGNKKYHLPACAKRAKQAMDKDYKVEQRLPDHKQWAQWLAKLPMNTELSARDIILELDGITSSKQHGLNGHKVGALLGKKGLRQELEKLGVTYKTQKEIRGSVYTFRKT